MYHSTGATGSLALRSSVNFMPGKRCTVALLTWLQLCTTAYTILNLCSQLR